MGAHRCLVAAFAGGLQSDPASAVGGAAPARSATSGPPSTASARHSTPAPGVLRATEAERRKDGTSYRRGAARAIDAVCRETAQERRTFQDEGVLPVEMESSALGTGARGQGAEAAARFTVSDLRDETERPPRFHETRSRLGAQRDFAIGAVSCLARAGKTERRPLAEAGSRRPRTGRWWGSASLRTVLRRTAVRPGGPTTREDTRERDRTLIPLSAARRRIRAFRFRTLPEVEVPTLRSLGQRVSRRLVATRSLPAGRRSAMDGFALRLLPRAPTGPYVVRGSAFPSSSSSRRPLRRGEAISITTGARLPPGTNAVVRSEGAHRDGERLIVAHAPTPGQDILETGESIERGAVLLERGQRIRPVELALLLAQGVRTVPVFRLRVSVLPIGDELVAAGGRSGAGTPDYLGPLIAGLLGAQCGLHPPLRDDRAQVARALVAASRRSDLVVTIGGSSIGRRDVTKGAVAEVGRLLFEGVTTNVLKRGAVGVVGRTPVLVLPGQLVSAVTVLHEHGLHVLSRRVGRELREYSELPLAEAVAVDHRMDSLYLTRDVDGAARILDWGVARMTELLHADGFCILDHGRRYRPGEPIRVQRLWTGF